MTNQFDVPPEWDLVPKDGGEVGAPTPDASAQFEAGDAGVEAAQEQLGRSLEQLEGNLAQLNTLSPEVVASPEGQEATESFLGNISARLKSFGSGIKEKVMSRAASLDNGDRVAAVLGSVAGIGILAPVLMQWARSRWPEVGVAMDMMPDVLQQLAHLDLASKISDLIGGSGQIYKWDTGNIDGMNLLADVASGRVDFAQLTEEQLSLLEQTLPPDTVPMMERVAQNPIEYRDFSGNDRAMTAQSVAQTNAEMAYLAPAVHGNLAVLGGSATAIGLAFQKVGQFARKSLRK